MKLIPFLAGAAVGALAYHWYVKKGTANPEVQNIHQAFDNLVTTVQKEVNNFTSALNKVNPAQKTTAKVTQASSAAAQPIINM